MKFFVLLTFFFLVFSQEFTRLNLEEPFDFEGSPDKPSLFVVKVETDKKSLIIKVLDSNPPQCIQDEGNVRINSTLTKEEVPTFLLIF